MFQKNQTFLITVIVFNLIAVFGCYFIIHGIISKNISASSVRNSIENKTREQVVLDSMESAIKNTSIDIVQLESHFVKKDDTVKFIEYVEGLAREGGIKLKTDSVDVEKPADDNASLEKINMTIEFSGNWANSFKFIKVLELMPYKTEIRDLSIDNQTGISENFFSLNNARKKNPEWITRVNFSVSKLVQ